LILPFMVVKSWRLAVSVLKCSDGDSKQAVGAGPV
jgi:hypothetical protein